MDTLFDMIRPLFPPGEFEKTAVEQNSNDPVNDGSKINTNGTKVDSTTSGENAASQAPHDLNNNAEGGNPTAPQKTKGPHNNRRGRRFHPNSYQGRVPPYHQQYYPMPMVQPTTPPEHIAVGRSVVAPNVDGNVSSFDPIKM